MVNFNLQQFALAKNCDCEDLKIWLQLKGYKYSFQKTIQLKDEDYKKIIHIANAGISKKFQPTPSEQIKSLKDNRKLIHTSIESCKEQLMLIEKRTLALASNRQTRKSIEMQIQSISKDVAAIEQRYRTSRIESQLKYDQNYLQNIKQNATSLLS